MQDFANINACLTFVLLGAHFYTVRQTQWVLQQNIDD